MSPENEGRGGNVAEEDAGGKKLLQDDRDEDRIGKENRCAFADGFRRTGFRFAALRARERFPERKDRKRKKHDARREHEPENAAPACEVRNECAEERRRHGRNALDRAHDAHEASELASRVAVRGNGSRHDDGARSAEPFEKAHDEKELNRGRRSSEGRGDGKNEKAPG